MVKKQQVDFCVFVWNSFTYADNKSVATLVWDALNFKILQFGKSDMKTKFWFKSFKFSIFSFLAIKLLLITV